MKSLLTTFVIPAHNSCYRLGQDRFASNLRIIKNRLQKNNPENNILVVDNSTDLDKGATQSAALAEGAQVITIPPINAGYARYCGVSHAFQNLGADVAIMGDDDLHVLPESIPDFIFAIERGADITLGVRSLLDRISHPLWQFFLEEAVNVYATHRFGIEPTRCFSLCTDFISGGQAFSRTGWQTFMKVVPEQKARQLGHAATFFPGVFKALGLKIKTVTVPGPYEGDYWRDSFDLRQVKKRFTTILGDIKDIEAAKRYF
jgi:hypothetical protein